MPRQTTIEADVEFEGEEATKLLEALKAETEKPTRDRLAGAVADEVVQQYIAALRENGSVITGEGVRSINSQHMGEGTYAVMMNDYLQQVDEGTSASERKPVDLDDRLVAAGKEYSMRPRVLQAILQDKGTRAHPFRAKAIERATGKLDEIAKAEIQKILDEATKK